MFKITIEDLKRYKKAQSIKTCVYRQVNCRQTKYGYFRWKASGLSLEKYLHIADNEDRYLGGKHVKKS